MLNACHTCTHPNCSHTHSHTHTRTRTLPQVFLKVTEATTDYGVRGAPLHAAPHAAEAELRSLAPPAAQAAGSPSAHAWGPRGAGGGAAGLGQPLLQPPGGGGGLEEGLGPGSDAPLLPRQQQQQRQQGVVRGWALLGQQLRALLTKRALCAARGRLTLLTQLAVPLTLVGARTRVLVLLPLGSARQC